MGEIDFNNENDLNNTMKEHSVEEIKDKTSKWSIFLITAGKLFLLWSLGYGVYKQIEWLF